MGEVKSGAEGGFCDRGGLKIEYIVVIWARWRPSGRLHLATAGILHLTCNAEIFNKPQVWLWPKKQVTLYDASRDRSDRGESTCNLPTKAVKLSP